VKIVKDNQTYLYYMFTFIATLILYIALLQWNKRYQIKYMHIHNITDHEYNQIIKEKMKNYNPYEHL